MTFLKKSKEKMVNTMIHMTIDHQPHYIFYLLFHTIMTIQIIATITNPASHLFLIVKWF